MLIVGDYDPGLGLEKSHFCESLGAAIRKAAMSSDVKSIELRFNGYRDKPEEPFTVAISELTVRPAAGYVPIVRFEPSQDAGMMSATTMMRFVGGRLRLEDIQFELDVPTGSEAEWALLQIEHMEELACEGCVMTVRSPYDVSHSAAAAGGSFINRDRVAVIDIQVPLGRDSMMDEDTEFMDPLTVIDMVDCVVRGEANLLRAEEALPFRFRWENGLLATSEHLLALGGMRQHPDESEGNIQIDLVQVTVFARRGLCAVNTDDQMYRHMMPVDINCSQCILSTETGAPLVEQVGPAEQTIAQLAERLTFGGERNFYENVGVFWRIKARLPLPVDGQYYRVKVFDAEDWRHRWREKLSQVNRVEWRHLPAPAMAVHEHTPKDYLLDARRTNPAVDSGPGPQRLDAGFILELLPELRRLSDATVPLNTLSRDSSENLFESADARR